MSDGSNKVAELEARLDDKARDLSIYASEMEDKLVTALLKQQELKSRISWLEAENDLLREGKIGPQAKEIGRLRAALIRLRDCDWVITLPDRMDAVRDIARRALDGK